MSAIEDPKFRKALHKRWADANSKINNFAAVTITGNTADDLMLQSLRGRADGEEAIRQPLLMEIGTALVAARSVLNSRLHEAMNDDYDTFLQILNSELERILGSIDARCNHRDIDQKKVGRLKESLEVYRDMMAADGMAAMEEQYKKIAALTKVKEAEL